MRVIDRACLVVGLVAAVGVGCGDDGGGSAAPGNNGVNNGTNNGVNNGTNNGVNNGTNNGVNNGTNNGTTDATWHEDVHPVIAEQCLGCHIDGGAAPFALDTYEAWQEYGPAAAAAISTYQMPPWQADPECRNYAGERIMPDTMRSMVVDWVNAGMPEGDPANATEFELPNLGIGTPSMITTAGAPYTPSSGSPDDYRCLVMDAEFDQDTFLIGHQIVPDEGAIVHHVLVAINSPDTVPSITNQDANSPNEPGFPCFGGFGGGELVGVWVPGATPTMFPDGAAYPIQAGSKVVLQVHYNTLTDDPVPDETEVQLLLSDEEPQWQISVPLWFSSVDIPAGEPSVTSTGRWTASAPDTRLVAAMPHMHLLGKSFDTWIERATGDQECLVELPQWDFNWQQFYELEEEDIIQLGPGDSVHWTCEWDNSPANQPTVNGTQLEPRDVRFGEGTLDEMCILIPMLMVPYDPNAAPLCGGFGDCYDACDGSDCLLTCATADLSCGQCLIEPIGACSQQNCGATLGPVVSCAQANNCFLDLGACTAEGGECAEEWAAHWECLGPVVDTGSCNNQFGECNVTF